MGFNLVVLGGLGLVLMPAGVAMPRGFVVPVNRSAGLGAISDSCPEHSRSEGLSDFVSNHVFK